MRLILCTVLLSVSLLLASSASSANWTKIAPSLQAAVVPIHCSVHERITCTAFSIDQERGHYITTSHCLHPAGSDDEDDVPLIDEQPLEVLFENTDFDLAVIKITTQRPALAVQTTPLQQGTEVASLGFALGRSVSSLRTAIVSKLDVATNDIPFVGFDNAFVGGMSGGPIVDRHGKVVGIATRTDAQSGYSLTIQFIYDHTRQFWADP